MQQVSDESERHRHTHTKRLAERRKGGEADKKGCDVRTRQESEADRRRGGGSERYKGKGRERGREERGQQK